MDIYAKPGTRITYDNFEAGYDYQRQEAEKYLKRGWVYTVDYIEVHRFTSDVYLKEIPTISFNTVMFSDDYDNRKVKDVYHKSIEIRVEADKETGKIDHPFKIGEVYIESLGVYMVGGVNFWVIQGKELGWLDDMLYRLEGEGKSTGYIAIAVKKEIKKRINGVSCVSVPSSIVRVYKDIMKALDIEEE